MLNIVCIGAGRLAHQLMPALQSAGARIVQVYNRSANQGQALAEKVNAESVTDDLAKINPNADLYFIVVSDDTVPSIASRITYLENGHAIFVHCSGVLDLDALPFHRKGVFYPLQSFSYEHPVDWQTTPLLITSGTEAINQELFALARRLSKAVYHIRDKDKAILHLSAVWANNFTNHMLAIAESICLGHRIDFDILRPIIRETFEKALESGAAKSQTGPALRGDASTMEKHARLMEPDSELIALYKHISEHISRKNTHI